MSAELDRRFEEWATWYINNVQRIPIVDPTRQWDFMTRAMAGLIEMFDQARNDLKTLEGRGRSLYVPISLEVSGDLHKVG